jgi:hypothetical protein
MGSRRRVVERPIPGDQLAHGVPAAVGNAHVCIGPRRMTRDCSPARPRSASQPHPDPDRLRRKTLKAVDRWRRGSLALVSVPQRHDWLPTVRILTASHDRADPGGRYKGSYKLPRGAWDELDGPTDARRCGFGAQTGREAGPTEEEGPNVGLVHGEVHATPLAATAAPVTGPLQHRRPWASRHV